MGIRTDNSNNISSVLFFFLIFILSVFIHSINLWSEPFWYDEIVSVKATLLDFGHVKHMAEWDNNPPLYYYCLWVWSKIVGISEFHIRLLSVIFQSFGAATLFWLVNKHFSLFPALFSSLALTLHDFTFYYSHEARCYSLVLMLGIISSAIFFKFLQNPKYYLAILLGLVNFLIIYSHYIAGMILFFQLLLFITYKQKKIKPFLVSNAILILLIILRFTKKQFFLIFSFSNKGDDFWLKKANSNMFTETISQLLGGSLIWIIMLLLFGTAIFLFFLKFKQHESIQRNIFFYCLCLSAINCLILFFVGKFTPVFLGRYLLYTIPFFLIIISTLFEKKNKIVLILPLALLIYLTIKLNTRPTKNMDYRTAVLISNKLRGESNAVTLLQTKDITALYAYYFDNDIFKNYKELTANLQKHNIYEIENIADFKTLNPVNNPVIIFLQTYEKETDNRQIFDIFIANKFKLATSRAVKGVKITLLKK